MWEKLMTKINGILKLNTAPDENIITNALENAEGLGMNYSDNELIQLEYEANTEDSPTHLDLEVVDKQKPCIIKNAYWGGDNNDVMLEIEPYDKEGALQNRYSLYRYSDEELRRNRIGWLNDNIDEGKNNGTFEVVRYTEGEYAAKTVREIVCPNGSKITLRPRYDQNAFVEIELINYEY